MVFCFVVGNKIENAFEVEGNSNISVSEFRRLIYDQNKNDFESQRIDANKLSLWKVDLPLGDDRLKKLENRSRDRDKENTTIKNELDGDNLLPNAYLGEIFSGGSDNVRIIVQPPLPATTGKCLTSRTRNSRYLTSCIFFHSIRKKESRRFGRRY